MALDYPNKNCSIHKLILYFCLFIRQSCAICKIIKTAKNAFIWISKQYAHSRSLLLFNAKYLLHKNHIDDATIIPQNIKSTNVTQRINSIISPGPTPITNPKQTSRDVNILDHTLMHFRYPEQAGIQINRIFNIDIANILILISNQFYRGQQIHWTPHFIWLIIWFWIYFVSKILIQNGFYQNHFINSNTATKFQKW